MTSVHVVILDSANLRKYSRVLILKIVFLIRIKVLGKLPDLQLFTVFLEEM